MTRLSRILLFLPLLACAGLALLLVPRASTQAVLDGAITPSRPAPNFSLHDQSGHTVTLSHLRGRVVVITFLEASCTEQCPLVADKIRKAVSNARAAGSQPVVLAITTAPESDTPGAIHTFLHNHALRSWHYLVGSRQTLAPIWHAYFVYAAPPSAPPAIRDSHTSATYIVDGTGQERVLLGGDPDLRSLTRDLRLLSGLPAEPPGAQLAAPEPGYTAPALSLRELSGRLWRLHPASGRDLLLNFWSSTCPPCRREMPLLDSWERKYGVRGLTIVGINNREDASTVRAVTRSMHIVYPIVLDTSGEAGSLYDLHALPESLLVDVSGTVRAVQYGMVDTRFLQAQVLPLLRPSA